MTGGGGAPRIFHRRRRRGFMVGGGGVSGVRPDEGAMKQRQPRRQWGEGYGGLAPSEQNLAPGA